MNAVCTLDLIELVKSEIETNSHIKGNQAWAVRSKDWYARRLGISVFQLNKFLKRPEFVVSRGSISGVRVPFVRICAPANEVEICGQLKRIMDAELRREFAQGYAHVVRRIKSLGGSMAFGRYRAKRQGSQSETTTSSTSGGVHFLERHLVRLIDELDGFETSYAEAKRYTETGTKFPELVLRLCKACGQDAPLVMRAVFDHWPNFVSVLKEESDWLASASTTNDITSILRLNAIASFPHLGIALTLAKLGQIQKNLVLAGAFSGSLTHTLTRLELALDLEISHLQRGRPPQRARRRA